MNSVNPVTWKVEDNGVAVVALNRPERLNALNLEVKRMIEMAIEELDADPEVRVIVITGENDVFVAGTDIAEMRDMTPTQHVREQTDRVFHVLRNCKKILIAAVEKFALGGGFELALACDLIFASENARFALPEIKVGIMPGGGGTQVLLRTIGKYRAMKMMLSGEMLTAAEVFTMGLISEVVKPGEALSRACEFGALVTTRPPLSVAAIKDVVSHGQNMPLTASLAFERRAFVGLFDSADQVEGMQAFLEKRQPEYKGS